ncbi:MAG: hypothetical protein A3J74_01590 [Elusimicrobia bacterium RIFCSPHIGHO2_02_FULL_57_9]|nr:MAG: hypothetical protein A3J74_01590 [Elusimicrobia bacterium RIFCSPHIGHO2_02_FULL_57_9]
MKITPAKAAALLIGLPLISLAAPDNFFDGPGQTPSSHQVQIPKARSKPIIEDPRLWITIPLPNNKEARSAIVNLGIAIEDVGGGNVGGVGTPRMAEELRQRGYSFTAMPLRERFALDFPAEDSIYHNYERLDKALESLASSAPDFVSKFPIGQSHEKKNIWALRLNTTAAHGQKSEKPGIVFMGTHHAREHLSTEVPLLLAQYLVENKQKPNIAKLLNTRDIYIIPMVNPDGVEWDIRDGSYHMHRKNKRANGRGSIGVDLNRNYGHEWGQGGSSPDPDSDIYRGPEAFSEPETQAIKNFIEQRKDNIKILLSFHAFSELILYPWGHSYDPIADSKALGAYEAMAKNMAGMNGYTDQQSSELYIASGDTTDWAWGAHNIFSFTFELTPKNFWDGGFYPGAAAVQTAFHANIRPALYLIDIADNPYRAKAHGGI